MLPLACLVPVAGHQVEQQQPLACAAVLWLPQPAAAEWHTHPKQPAGGLLLWRPTSTYVCVCVVMTRLLVPWAPGNCGSWSSGYRQHLASSAQVLFSPILRCSAAQLHTSTQSIQLGGCRSLSVFPFHDFLYSVLTGAVL